MKFQTPVTFKIPANGTIINTVPGDLIVHENIIQGFRVRGVFLPVPTTSPNDMGKNFGKDGDILMHSPVPPNHILFVI